MKNVPLYARCDTGICPGHDFGPDVKVYGAALPIELDDRGAEVAIALAADVSLTYGARQDGVEYEPTIGIHKGPLTDFGSREWIATAARSVPQ